MKLIRCYLLVLGMCLFCVSTARAQQDPGFVPFWDDFLNLTDSLIFQTADGRIVIDTSTPFGNPLLTLNNSGDGPALQVSAVTRNSQALLITQSGLSGSGLEVRSSPAVGNAIFANCTGDPRTDCVGVFAVGTHMGIAASAPPGGLAGGFSGNVRVGGNLDVTGTLTKGSGMFKLDHPLDPANKYLSHSFVESPDMMNIYNGVVVLDRKGEAWVSLPDWFESLNRDFRYQLTALGAPQPRLYIAKEISGNRFKIAGGKPGRRVSWQATGVRQDAYANAHRIVVEEDKPLEERGYYLHPEVFGQPETKSISALRMRRPESVPAASNSGDTAGRR